MKKLIQKWWMFLFAAVFSVSLLGCGDISTGNEELDQAIVNMVVDGVNSYLEDAVSGEESTDIADAEEAPAATATPEPAIEEDGWYYSKEDVALYIYTYGKLPENFITKNEARDLGWEGGSVEHYKKGAAIGGDKFGNYEGLLPKKSGRKYYECDIDTNGKNSRGAKRIIFSNDGLIYYTDDHYESFTMLYGEE